MLQVSPGERRGRPRAALSRARRPGPEATRSRPASGPSARVIPGDEVQARCGGRMGEAPRGAAGRRAVSRRVSRSATRWSMRSGRPPAAPRRRCRSDRPRSYYGRHGPRSSPRTVEARELRSVRPSDPRSRQMRCSRLARFCDRVGAEPPRVPEAGRAAPHRGGPRDLRRAGSLAAPGARAGRFVRALQRSLPAARPGATPPTATRRWRWCRAIRRAGGPTRPRHVVDAFLATRDREFGARHLTRSTRSATRR